MTERSPAQHGLCYCHGMSDRFRTLLLWLLIAALPLQGFAATLRYACSPTQMTTWVATGKVQQDAQTAVHEQHATGGHAAMSMATDGTTDSENSQPHKNTSCSTCSDCCVGALAVPSAMVWRVPASKVATQIVAVVAPLAGFIPDGLERPPRHT